MLRKIIYAMLIAVLTIEAASAQEDKPSIQSMPGYSPMRTQQERQKDREIDHAYKSTINKALSDTEKKKSDPWGDVRPAPPAAAKNKQ